MPELEFALPRELADADNLPSPPGVVFEILRLANDQSASAGDLAEVIAHDPALTSRLLRIVNSPHYGMRGTVDSVSRAVTVLGFRPVRLLALAFSVTDAIPPVDSTTGFDLGGFWVRSLVGAATGRTVATRRSRVLADSGFVAGLLSNLGRLVIAHCVPDRYAPVLAIDSWPDPELERENLGYASTDVTAGLLSQWGLPDRLCTAMLHQYWPERLPSRVDDETRLLTHVLTFANIASETARRSPDELDFGVIAAAGDRYLGLGPNQVVEVLQAIRAELRGAEGLLKVQLPRGVTAEAITDQARTLVTRLLNARSEGALTRRLARS